MIWMFITIFGIAAGLSAALRRRIELCFAPAVFSIILVLYLFALAGQLVAGCWAVVALGALGAAWAVFSLAHWRGETARLLITPGAAGFAVMMAIAWYAHRGQLFCYVDEFTHWGLVIKAMFTTRCLPHGLPENLLYYSDYPPATALFSTCWMLLTGAYSEGLALTSANVLLMSCFMPLMQHTEWKRWKEALALGTVGMMLPMVFNKNIYQMLYVDIPVGAVGAYALMIHFTAPKDGKSQALSCLALAVLPLIKSSGFLIALIVLMVMGIDELFTQEEKPRRARLLRLLLPLVCALLAKASWSSVLQTHHIVSRWQYDGFQLSAIMDMFTGKAPSHRQYAVLNFFIALTNPEMTGDSGHLLHPSYVMWLVVMMLTLSWLRSHSKQDARVSRWVRAGTALTVGSMCYAVGQLFMFAFMFHPTEAARLTSFERYQSTYMVMLITVMVAFALEYRFAHPPKAIPAALAVMALLLVVVDPGNLIALTGTATRTRETASIKRMEVVAPADVSIPLDSSHKVAFIAQGISDFDFYVNHYEFYPITLEQAGGFAIFTSTKNRENVSNNPLFMNFACICTPQEWAETLLKEGFTHVYLHNVDAVFVKDYGVLFDSPASELHSGTLYAVEEGGEAGVTLRRVV